MAKTFHAKVQIIVNDRAVNAKKVNTLLSLSLVQGDTFILSTQGKDAQIGQKALALLFESLMQKDTAILSISKSTHHYESPTIEGEIIAKGIAIAPLISYQKVYSSQESHYSFSEAISQSIEALQQSDTPIALAQKALLLTLQEECTTLESFESKIAQECQILKSTPLSSKIVDYQDICQRVQSYLGKTASLIFPQEAFILLAKDLLPSEIDKLSQSNVQGVILQETSIHSHTAILLRGLAIPSLSITDKDLIAQNTIILDANAGVVLPSPSTQELQQAHKYKAFNQTSQASVHAKRLQKAETLAGKTIKVYANVGDVRSASQAKQEGAEGIGLLRSEFLFQAKQPTLQTQIDAYTEICRYFEDITIRTLDVGGDKALPYINIPLESNPFLGIRGIRLFRTHPEIIAEQLHAIFIASQGKKIKIMFPMVSTAEEFVSAKTFALNVAKKQHIDIGHIAFGIMVEVPSVLFLIESFNEVVDFYSIGTNDLTQYLFATERTHPILKIDVLSPVVFSAIKMLMKHATKPVSICGELASNDKAIADLISLGIETLSVSPKSIAHTKETIRHV
ncbi:MAG: putative PEP-binding protein [Sulfurovum sp.]|nr:putative PEP-binding protein [Sulfurovum sp.]